MFICFEGIDGSGKSTQANMLADRLRNECANRAEVARLADPGTTPLGLAIRQLLLQSSEPISGPAQMLLFSAARAELAAHIQQLLSEGAIVICDRWLLSTFVYQGEINNISVDLITNIFNETSGVQPDFCFLLDLPVEEAKSRIQRPGDRYENRCVEDRRRMRAAYLRHAVERPHAHTVCMINAEQSPGKIHELVYDAIRERISQKLTGGQLHGRNARRNGAGAAT